MSVGARALPRLEVVMDGSRILRVLVDSGLPSGPAELSGIVNIRVEHNLHDAPRATIDFIFSDITQRQAYPEELG